MLTQKNLWNGNAYVVKKTLKAVRFSWNHSVNQQNLRIALENKITDGCLKQLEIP